MTNKLKVMDEESAEYLASDEYILQRAQEIMMRRMRKSGHLLTSPATAIEYLRMQMHNLEKERFDVLFLDTKHRVIAHEILFTGTLTKVSVYPREVLKAALKHNACSIMLAHNHPSGEPSPSDADLNITNSLKQALALVDIKVLDHFIIAGMKSHSFAENGQI